MQTEPQHDPMVAFVLRWWWLLAIGVIVGIGGAYAYSQYGPTPYSSKSLIQVQTQTTTDPTANTAQARSATANYAAEAVSSRMHGLVADALPETAALSQTELTNMVRSGAIVISPQSNFISITVTDDDPVRAELLANTFASVFVEDVNQRAGEQLDAYQVHLQEQIDFSRDQLAVSQLFQQQQSLEQDLRDERTDLLSLQASHRLELTNQTVAVSSRTGGNTESEGGISLEAILVEQIDQVKLNIDAIQAELSNVKAAIVDLPPTTEPLLSSVYAGAYAAQLTTLTSQYVHQQLASLTATLPLAQYGEASQPISAQGIKKLLVIGIAAGGLVFAGLAFGIDLLRNRRRRAQTRMQQLGIEDDIAELLKTLDLSGVTTPVSVRQTSGRTHFT